MESYSDDELIKKYLDGDETAFIELYTRYKIVLYNFILSLVKDKTISEDIFQETFIRVIDKISKYKPGNFKAFLFTVARNIIIDEIRKKSKNIELTLSSTSADEEYDTLNNISAKEDTQELILKKIESERIYIAIEKLPTQYKEIIYLKHFADLTFDDISKITGTPIGTLLSRFKRAIDKLKILLSQIE